MSSQTIVLKGVVRQRGSQISASGSSIVNERTYEIKFRTCQLLLHRKEDRLTPNENGGQVWAHDVCDPVLVWGGLLLCIPVSTISKVIIKLGTGVRDQKEQVRFLYLLYLFIARWPVKSDPQCLLLPANQATAFLATPSYRFSPLYGDVAWQA